MKIALFSILTLILPVALAWAEKSEIRVAEKSTVRVGEPVRLGTLISGQIQDADLSGKIYNLVVFDAITSEEEKTYKSDELALILRQKLSFHDLQKLSMKIPEQVRVQARRNFIHASDLMRDISEKAKVLCSGCSIEFDDLKVPDLKIREEVLQTRLDTQNLKAAGSFLLPLQVETSQGRQVFWVTGKIAFFKNAPVAKRMIRAGEHIQEHDVEIKRVDVSFAKDGAPTMEELTGKVSTRLLTVGQAIYSSDLKKEPAATRGQVIQILIGSSGFEVSTTGIAEETGSIGDVIRVKSSDTQKLLSGVLIDKATVRIQ